MRIVRVKRLAPIALLVAALAAIAAPPSTAFSADNMFFLVATRDLPDPMFQESVILMIPDTPPPLVVGLIVNKPIGKRLNELMPESPILKDRTDDALFGGPVDIEEPSLVLRAADAPTHARALFDGVYAVFDPHQVVALLKSHNAVKDLRLYFGRAQWSRDQLHSEMLRGSWYVVPADPSFVFSSDPKHIWRALVERAELRKATFAPEALP